MFNGPNAGLEKVPNVTSAAPGSPLTDSTLALPHTILYRDNANQNPQRHIEVEIRVRMIDRGRGRDVVLCVLFVADRRTLCHALIDISVSP